MDGASPNRKLMRLHKGALDATGIVYKVYDPFSEDKRHLYFISDPPHLVKTMQNCWYKRRFWVSIDAMRPVSTAQMHGRHIEAPINFVFSVSNLFHSGMENQ